MDALRQVDLPPFPSPDSATKGKIESRKTISTLKKIKTDRGS
jgi:hypothetical protein